MAFVVYFTSVSSSKEIKKKQTQVFDWLDSKKVKYEKKDVASDFQVLKEMRDKVMNEKALVPQIFKEGTHLGDYDDIERAVESKALCAFLKLSGDEDPCQQMQQKLSGDEDPCQQMQQTQQY